jgi:hypothetical protein
MRSIALGLGIALIALGASKPADNIAWGEEDHGVRIGLAHGAASPEPQIRVIFQNVNRPQCLLPLGSQSAKGPVYDIEFAVTSPAGKQSPVFNFNGPPGIQHEVKPIILDIPRGQTREVDLSMKKLIYADKGQNRPLTDLLAQHYTVHASVDTSGDARWSRTLNQWMGKAISGELRQP